MNQSEQPIITILAEGGSIKLFKTNETFLFYTSEIIDYEDDFIIKKVPKSFPSFSEAFTALFTKYPIFKLHLDEVYPSYITELKEHVEEQIKTVEEPNNSWLAFLKIN
jgi:radical SAM superfamily enzyme with C-terminal helix-hairpin-helix motif